MSDHGIRIVLPSPLQKLAAIDGEFTLQIESPVTHDSIVDAIERAYPMLRGTIRDHVTRRRRPLLRYFVCSKDVSHEPADTPVSRCCAVGRRAVYHLGRSRWWLSWITTRD